MMVRTTLAMIGSLLLFNGVANADNWQFAEFTEDWGKVCQASQSNDAGEEIRLWRSDQAKLVVHLMLERNAKYSAIQQRSYPTNLTAQWQIDKRPSFASNGVPDDYSGALAFDIQQDGFVQRLIAGRNLHVELDQVGKISFALSGTRKAMKSFRRCAETLPASTPGANATALSNQTHSNDGVRLIVSKVLGVVSALELDGAVVCVVVESDAERKVFGYFERNGMGFEPLIAETGAQAREVYEQAACDVLATSDANEIRKLAAPADHLVLNEVID